MTAMRNVTALIPLLGLAMMAATAADTPPILAPGSPVLCAESFEGTEVPAYVSAAKGKLSLSETIALDGAKSLRWDWVPGDKLTFKTGPLGDINVWTDYGGYNRSAFAASVYTDTTSDKALTFRWMAGDKTGATFKFPLVFRGWQSVCYHYSYNCQLENRNQKALQNTDRIVVEAPPEGEGGTVYFDLLDFNKPKNFGAGRKPVVELWKPREPAAAQAPPSAAELRGVTDLLAVLTPKPGAPATEAQVAEVERRLNDVYKLRRTGTDTVSGRAPANLSATVSADLLRVANLWTNSARPESAALRLRLEIAYLLLDDYFRCQGAAPQGSVGGLYWYPGRAHGDACFIMSDALRRHGRLPQVRDRLKYHWAYDKIFEVPPPGQDMGCDYFYINTRYLLNIALRHDSPAEQVAHLRAFTCRFNQDIMNTAKTDGSWFHHGFYNFPYVGYTLPTLAVQLKTLAPTPFRVSPEAFAKVKETALAMRWFCNLTDATLSMHGRHPGRLSLVPRQYLDLAEAGRPYNGGKLDPELVAAYLRFVPQDAAKPEFASEGIVPVPAPQGNRAMNYAALMGHRRGEWLAVVRGYSKHSPAQESYAAQNRHGLFMGNGYMEVLASGDPIGLVASGCDVEHGWDWRHLDGTTSFDAPLAVIANGNRTSNERSDVGFVGGLSHRGRNGVFVFPLHSKAQYSKALPEGTKNAPTKYFTANKSYFFFDNHIICLGSDISLPDLRYPVLTTLFQKHLKEPSTPVTVDGRQLSSLPSREELPSDMPHTLMDIQNTGYYVPAGQNLVVTRGHQKSRDGHDEKDTEGDYVTAWLDHGLNPDSAGYEYAVLPATTPEALAEFAGGDSSSLAAPRSLKSPPSAYKVYRKDAAAHLVYDRPAKTWGCVLFKPGDVALASPLKQGDPRLPVKAVDRPCLVMAERLDDGGWTLSVCDPESNPQATVPNAIPLRLLLAGSFQAVALPEGVKLQAAGADTALLVACGEGRSFQITLKHKE